MVAGMSRDESVARLVRAGELWMTGENPDEIRAAFSPEFTFHAPGVEVDYDGLAALNRLIEMKLAGGEGNRGINEFRELLERGCFDIVQPEVMLEGPTHLRKIAILAEAMNKMCIPHVGDSRLGTICDLHLVASWPNAPYLEIFNDRPIGNYEHPFAIFENPPTIDKEGYFSLPPGPGLGMTIKKEFLS